MVVLLKLHYLISLKHQKLQVNVISKIMSHVQVTFTYLIHLCSLASTTFITRSFPNLRFKRSVLEGYIEDLIDEENLEEQVEADNFWDLLFTNATLMKEFNETANSQEWEVFLALKGAQILDRPKRQAGFPGVKQTNDNK